LFQRSAPPRDHHHHRPPPVWVFHRRRQFCVFQHRSTVAGENQKTWQQTNVCRHLRVLGLFLSGPIPIPVALGRIKSTCNAETWNFHPRFASVCPRSRRHGRASRIFQRVSAIVRRRSMLVLRLPRGSIPSFSESPNILDPQRLTSTRPLRSEEAEAKLLQSVPKMSKSQM
jgi:hypothetical protein